MALEALVRFSDEELKHQELFRRIEQMIAAKMPPGYHFVPQPNEVANAVLSKSTWAVLGLTLMIELFTQTHYLKKHPAGPGMFRAVQRRFPLSLEGRVSARPDRRVGMGS